MGDEADYVASQNQTEDVRLLSTQVNERLKQAIESDSLLAGIYKNLSNGAVVSTSEDEKNADSQVMIGDGADASSGTGEETTGADAAEGTQVRHRQKEQKKPRQKQQGITLMQL